MVIAIEIVIGTALIFIAYLVEMPVAVSIALLFLGAMVMNGLPRNVIVFLRKFIKARKDKKRNVNTTNGVAKAIASLIRGGFICEFSQQYDEYCAECPHKNTCEKGKSKEEKQRSEVDMDDKNKIFYAVKNDDGSCGEFKPFEIGEIPTPPTCETANIEKLCATFNLCAEVVKSIAESIEVAIKPIVKTFCELCIDIYDGIYKSFTNNKKVVHLATHAKKYRTRKKNRNRMIKYVLNQIERAGKIDKKDSDEGN